MIERARKFVERSRGLGFRLAMLLSLAILPTGLISLIQTMQLTREAERTIEAALLGTVSTAAAGERALLQTAIGSADALGPAVIATKNDAEACSEVMRAFVERNSIYAYAGFTSIDGFNTCSSGYTGVPVDLRGTVAYEKFRTRPATHITPIMGPITGRDVVLVAQPLYHRGGLLGYVGISIDRAHLRSTHEATIGVEGAQLLSFTTNGEVITAPEPARISDYAKLFPRNESASTLIGRAETTFSETSEAGDRRVFAVVTVVPNEVYALGSWTRRSAGVTGLQLNRIAAFVLPIALWAMSLFVAYLAVYRLVLRHVGELRGQMRRFALGRRDTPPRIMEEAPAEIADVSRTFYNLVRIINRDEQQMAEAVAEKTVLLKEVHHRVKNNLQLIASIINMQNRMITDADAKRVLRSVQDRVASLATIYRNLYQAERLDAVEADILIRDVINQMSNASIAPGDRVRIETDLEPLVLTPDQAVPLMLLATECFTNALKYAGPAPGSEVTLIKVRLCNLPDERAEFGISNTLAPEGRREFASGMDGTGLGSQLIEAFSTQLDAEVTQSDEDGEYSFTLSFDVTRVEDTEPERPPVLTSTPRPGAHH